MTTLSFIEKQICKFVFWNFINDQNWFKWVNCFYTSLVRQRLQWGLKYTDDTRSLTHTHTHTPGVGVLHHNLQTSEKNEREIWKMMKLHSGYAHTIRFRGTHTLYMKGRINVNNLMTNVNTRWMMVWRGLSNGCLLGLSRLTTVCRSDKGLSQ
jgi:hypothetical protein